MAYGKNVSAYNKEGRKISFRLYIPTEEVLMVVNLQFLFYVWKRKTSEVMLYAISVHAILPKFLWNLLPLAWLSDVISNNVDALAMRTKDFAKQYIFI